MNKNFYTVIMAGGVGSRFWPLSREKKPKQFLDVLNTGKTLLQATFERFTQVCPEENIYIVANQDYEEIIKEQIPGIKDEQLLLEPVPRNTAPCITYASLKIYAHNPEATMVVSPSDHLIINEQDFKKTITTSLEFASQHEVLVTLGITPNRPDTGYGYIQMNEEIKKGDFYKVKTFTEKPNRELAEKFVQSGEFLWNAGIFVWSAKSIIYALNKYLPEVVQCFEFPDNIYFSPEESKKISQAYTRCPTISIDYGVMEKADNVFVIPCSFGWSDIGTWNSLFEFLDKDENNNAVKGKYVFTRNVTNCIINVSDDHLVAVNNVDNLIIVQSGNIILVADKNREQDIRHVVNEIKSRFRDRFV